MNRLKPKRKEKKKIKEIKEIKNLAPRYVCDTYPDGVIPQEKLYFYFCTVHARDTFNIDESVMTDFYDWLCRNNHASLAEPMLGWARLGIITAGVFVCNCSKCRQAYKEKRLKHDYQNWKEIGITGRGNDLRKTY